MGGYTSQEGSVFKEHFDVGKKGFTGIAIKNVFMAKFKRIRRLF